MSATVDPLATPSTLMKITGVINMILSGLMALFFTITGIVAHAALVLALFAAAAFVGSYFVFSAGTAMKGRYTYKHCQFGSIVALVSGPLGLAAGIASLLTLRRAEVRGSFNS
jgi:hypothetical protein